MAFHPFATLVLGVGLLGVSAGLVISGIRLLLLAVQGGR